MGGLFNQIKDRFSNAINSMGNQMATITNSFLHQGSMAIMNTGLSSDIGKFRLMSDDMYFDFLKDYHFISAMVDIFSSCIDDVIGKNKFECTIKGDDLHTKRANRLIENLQLKQFIRDNLRDMIYHGVYAFGIDYEKEKLYSIENPYNVTIITDTRDIIGYEINNRIIKPDYLSCYYYKTEYESVRNIDEDVHEELKGLVVKFKNFKGKGLFNDKLDRIFQLYAFEYVLYYLGLRESMKPTLLSMSSGGRSVNFINATDMANSIESLINEPVTGLTQIADPVTYMNQLVFSLLNNVKVVPSIEQYNNISDINSGDISQKREKLQQEKDQIQKEILSELTVPEEIFMGTGNRWETASRSDRFLTTIDNILTSITRLVKTIISKYTGISTVSISFDLDTTMLVASYDVKDKTTRASEKMGQINSLMNEVNNLVSNPFVYSDKAFDYIKSQIYAIDSKLGDILLSNYNQKSDNTDNENNDTSNEDKDKIDDEW